MINVHMYKMFYEFCFRFKIPPKKLVGLRGKILLSQSREIISNAARFFMNEAENGVTIPIV